MFGRVFLFILTNILVLTTLTIFASIFGLGSYMDASGIDYSSLMVLCLFYGFGGSFISLAISRWMAKKVMGVELLQPGNAGEYEWLVVMVHNLAKSAGLPKMPEVGVFANDSLNAFATGPSRSRSLVAFSSGIIGAMSRDELEGVAAHEIAHIQNGDMVTMTLLQGVINAFVMFFARIAAYAASQSVREEMSQVVWFVTAIVFQIVFGILGMIVTCWFSRKREFRADSGSATLAGREKMIAALESLARHTQISKETALPQSVSALGINNSSGFLSLISTHPPLDVRIKALKEFQGK